MKKILTFMFAAVCFTMLTACSSSDDDVDVFCTIYGTITDASTGEPVDKATITLAPGGKSTITGSDGLYSFDNNIGEGQYRMTVQKDGYETNYKDVTAIAGAKVLTNITLTKKK